MAETIPSFRNVCFYRLEKLAISAILIEEYQTLILLLNPNEGRIALINEDG